MQNTMTLLSWLGPILALLDIGLRVLPGGAGRAMRLQSWWAQPHWLVVDWPNRLRAGLAAPVFCAIAALWIGGFESAEMLLDDFAPPHWLSVFVTAESLCLAALLLGKILFCSRYSGRQLAVVLVVGWLVVRTHAVHGFDPLLNAFLFLLAAKDTRLKWNLRALFWGQLVNLATHVALVVSGQEGMMLSTEGGRTRVDLGYGSYNALGWVVAILAVYYICLRWQKLRWWDLLLCAAVLVFAWYVPNSRGSLLLVGGTLAVGLCMRFWPGLFARRGMRGLLCGFPLLAAVGSFGLSIGFDAEQPWVMRLDELLTGRIGLASNVVAEMPPRLFGYLMDDFVYRVDNSYVCYYAALGWLLWGLWLAGSCYLLWIYLHRGGMDTVLVAVLLGFALYALMERVLTPGLYSMLLGGALWGRWDALTLCPATGQEDKPC